MNITGLEGLIFGVDDLPGCMQYLDDYGLDLVSKDEHSAVFESLDGGTIEVRLSDDDTLPPANAPSPNLRETIYGVTDASVLDAIEAEFRRDREVTRGADGSVHILDDNGFALAFQISKRRPIDAPFVGINVPGEQPQREINTLGVEPDWPIYLRKLSHVVIFVPDLEAAERFYVDRLDFRVTDRFTGSGVFLRPKGEPDHHSLFLMKAFFEGLSGIEHFAFHVASANEVLQAGHRFQAKGYKSFWGPGRHLLGSNYFWYFNSPLGANVEYDADMDMHDDNWTPRDAAFQGVTAQAYLFKARDFWTPMDGPPDDA